MKFFQEPASNTSGGHDLGKFTRRFFRFRVHGDLDDTPFAFQLNFFVRGSAISFQTKSVTKTGRPALNPQKLLMSKWTAVEARDKERHFLVERGINPEAPKHKIQEVEMEAVMSKRRFILGREELTDATRWVQGWQ